MCVEKLILQFLNQHNYFSQIWPLLGFEQKRKVLYIIVSRKGLIPYEKIISIDSLNSKPENGILFTKDGFYSTLKGKAVDEEEYINSKLLYTLLKMRDMSDLNDLYTAHGVILLCEIFEDRFQTMYEKSGFSPRKCHSASKLSLQTRRSKSNS